MTNKKVSVLGFVLGFVLAVAFLAACANQATEPTILPSFDNVGDPCDPETYSGPYRCVPNPNGVGGYILAD